MSKLREFSSRTIKEIGSYVYVYSDPNTHEPFYIGKGKGNRCFAHLKKAEDGSQEESEKVARIKEIAARGQEPLIEILVHGVDDETALKVEAAAIDLIGKENLSNRQKGHGAGLYGRINVDDLEVRYNPSPLNREEITENVIMIRVNKTFRYGMEPWELYDVTRCAWKVNLNTAKKVDYAFSVYNGIVLEVYKVLGWFPGHSTMNSFFYGTEQEHMEDRKTRYEFVGCIAEQEIRAKYKDRDVSGLFPKGNQNSFKYVLNEPVGD